MKKLFGMSSPNAFGRISICLLVMLLACVAFIGCARKYKDPRITPLETAREILKTSLTAWQNGKPPDKLEAASHRIQVVDSVWKRGEKLKSYEIVGEETDKDGLQWFSVRLQVENSDNSKPVKYLVMGRSTIAVFREEDYMLSRSWKAMEMN